MSLDKIPTLQSARNLSQKYMLRTFLHIFFRKSYMGMVVLGYELVRGENSVLNA
jgi:hypothetical protein